jgi:hypothetical protein
MTKRPKIKVLALFFLFFYSSQGIANIGSGKSYVKDGVYFSDVQLPFRLEKQQVEALGSGLTLRFQLDFYIVDIRNWRIDRDIGTLNQSYSIRLNAFTGRYLITNLNIGTKVTLSSIQEVENFLSEIKNIPLVDDSILDIEKNYSVILQAGIAAEGISQWIKTLSFWRENLDTEFEAIEWKLLD